MIKDKHLHFVAINILPCFLSVLMNTDNSKKKCKDLKQCLFLQPSYVQIIPKAFYTSIHNTI